MPTLTEKIDSREWTTGERPSVTLHYILDGTSDDLTAKTWLLNSTATEYDGLARDDCSLEPIFVDTAAGAGKWDCRARYVAPGGSTPPPFRESARARNVSVLRDAYSGGPVLARVGTRTCSERPTCYEHQSLVLGNELERNRERSCCTWSVPSVGMSCP